MGQYVPPDGDSGSPAWQTFSFVAAGPGVAVLTFDYWSESRLPPAAVAGAPVCDSERIDRNASGQSLGSSVGTDDGPVLLLAGTLRRMWRLSRRRSLSKLRDPRAEPRRERSSLPANLFSLYIPLTGSMLRGLRALN